MWWIIFHGTRYNVTLVNSLFTHTIQQSNLKLLTAWFRSPGSTHIRLGMCRALLVISLLHTTAEVKQQVASSNGRSVTWLLPPEMRILKEQASYIEELLKDPPTNKPFYGWSADGIASPPLVGPFLPIPLTLPPVGWCRLRSTPRICVMKGRAAGLCHHHCGGSCHFFHYHPRGTTCRSSWSDWMGGGVVFLCRLFRDSCSW